MRRAIRLVYVYFRYWIAGGGHVGAASRLILTALLRGGCVAIA